MSTLQKTANLDSGALKPLLRGELLSTPTNLLRVENLAILVGLTSIYGTQHYAWWLIPVLILSPDVSMLGYLAGTDIGAKVYNIVHTYAAPILLALATWALSWPFGMQLALIWGMHIAMDRTIGYGLKYADSFKHTHLTTSQTD